MKVLLVNGSPHKNGSTNRALEEVVDKLGVKLPERGQPIFMNFIRE